MSDGRFKRGHVPWNLGKSYTLENHANKTSFKEAKKHPRYRPIGSERIDKDDYIILKIADRKWKRKHRHLWEKYHNRKIPREHVILFADGNNRNFDIDNLLLIGRRQLAVYNKKYKQTTSGELNEATLNLINLELAIKDKEKRNGS